MRKSLLALFGLPILALPLVFISKTPVEVNADTPQQISGIVDFDIQNLDDRSFLCADFFRELSEIPLIYTLTYDNGRQYTRLIDSPDDVPDSLKHYMGEVGEHTVEFSIGQIAHYEVADESIEFDDELVKSFTFTVRENPSFEGFDVHLIDTIGEQEETLTVPYYGKIVPTISTAPVVKSDDPGYAYVFDHWSHTLDYAESDLTIYMERSRVQKSYYSRNAFDADYGVPFQVVDKVLNSSGDLRVLVYLGRTERFVLKHGAPIYHEENESSILSGSLELPSASDFVESTSEYVLNNLYEYDASRLYNISMRGSRSSLTSDLEYMSFAPNIYSKVGELGHTALLDPMEEATYYARSGYHSYYNEALDDKVVDYSESIPSSQEEGYYRYEVTADIDLFLDLSFSIENTHYVFNDDARFYIDYVQNSYAERYAYSEDGGFEPTLEKKIAFSDNSLLSLAKIAFGEYDLDEWAASYMYMDDPAFEGEGTGRCSSQGLYLMAKRELLKLDDVMLLTFHENKIGKYEEILARYLAWARACGDESPFAGEGIISPSQNPLGFVAKGNMAVVILLIVSITAVSAMAVVFVKRKRRRG